MAGRRHGRARQLRSGAGPCRRPPADSAWTGPVGRGRPSTGGIRSGLGPSSGSRAAPGRRAGGGSRNRPEPGRGISAGGRAAWLLDRRQGARGWQGFRGRKTAGTATAGEQAWEPPRGLPGPSRFRRRGRSRGRNWSAAGQRERVGLARSGRSAGLPDRRTGRRGQDPEHAGRGRRPPRRNRTAWHLGPSRAAGAGPRPGAEIRSARPGSATAPVE